MPSLGTYSTSLNLLFFYLTWSTLVLSQPPLKVEVVGTLAVRIVFFVVPSTLFLLLDTLLPSLAVGIKRQGAQALPTRTGGVARTRRGDRRPQWYQVIGLSLFNICLGVTVQAGIEILFTDVFQIRSALKVTTTLPMPWSIVKGMLRALLFREVSSCLAIHNEDLIGTDYPLSQRSCSTLFIAISTVRLPLPTSAIYTACTITQSPRRFPLPHITTTLYHIFCGDSFRCIFQILLFERIS